MRPPDSPSTDYLYANKWRIWGVVMVGLFMALIDVTIVNISIPQLQRDLDAPPETLSSGLNHYNTIVAALPSGGRACAAGGAGSRPSSGREGRRTRCCRR